MLQDAKWIKSAEHGEEKCYEFYISVNLNKKVLKAVLSVSAMGLYRAFIDNERIGNEVLTPYLTDCQRVQYQTYDVTDMMKERFELSFICAEGWAIGQLFRRCTHADHISLIYSLDIMFEDGSSVSYVSDENTKVRTSYIISSSFYNGETVDMTAKRCELGNGIIDTSVKAEIVPQEGEKVTEQETVLPIKIFTTPNGERVIDFGQNLAGYVQITLSGNRGDVIELSHAEVLDKDGNFYTKNLRSAKQKMKYTMCGNGVEVFKPTFTWQGFRYIRIDKFPNDEIDINSIKAIVIHSDIKPRSTFICGNKKINQLYHNVIWGQKSNFIDIPTDCPQRDERIGWCGDAQVFVRTAAINYDVERFFGKWLHDLALGQRYDGGIYQVAPTLNGDRYATASDGVSAGWSDAAVICPWEIYMAYGNEKVLQDQFESMKKWVDYIHNTGEEEFLWIGDNQFGDWLAADGGENSYSGATPPDYIASAYFAYSTSLLIKAGKILGVDMKEYEALYDNILSAFCNKFTENGIPMIKTQTAYALALYFDLCPNKKATAYELNKLVRENGTRLSTGFIGTPYLLYALSDNGYSETAFDLLFQENLPSWLYQVNHGATTVWEHWDSIKPDGSFWPDDMNSFNHYAYGAVFSWIFEIAGGIQRNEKGAGYSDIVINPRPDKRLGFLNSNIKTKYGTVSSNWYYGMEGNIHFEFEIPAGISAKIILPDGVMRQVTSGKYCYTVEPEHN